MPSTKLYHVAPGSKIVLDDLDPDAWPYYIVIGDRTLKTMPEKYKNSKGDVRVRISARAPAKNFNRESLILVTKHGSERLGAVLES